MTDKGKRKGGIKGQFAIDRIRKELRESNPTMLMDLDRLVARKPGATAIHSFLVEIGCEVSYSAVWNWYQKKFPETFDCVSALLKKAEEMNDLASKIIDGKELPKGVTAQMLPAIIREFRSMCSQLNDMKFVKDSQELELNGIYFAFAEIEEAQKDTAFEQVVKDLKRGVIAKYEGR